MEPNLKIKQRDVLVILVMNLSYLLSMSMVVSGGNNERTDSPKITLSFKVDGIGLGNGNIRHQIIKRVHKFSIGRDFNSAEIDKDVLYKYSNSSLYSNVPATLSTKAIQTTRTNSSLKNNPFVTSAKFTTTTRNNPIVINNQSENRKLTEIKRRIKKLNLKSGSSNVLINQILNDVLSAKQIDYSKITKGRTIEDTRDVLNSMLLGLHQIRAREQDSFDSLRFFDQVIIDPTEVSPDGLFEKDIVLSKEQARRIFIDMNKSNYTKGIMRKVIKDSVYRWPLPIYFLFDNTHDATERDLIRRSLKRWEEQTCLVFKEITTTNTEIHYLKFTRGQGCWSPVGYAPGAKYQDISLGDGCLNKGTIMHEVGHTLGFFHEQSRPDRDDYIDIVRKNIAKFRENNFEKYTITEIENYDEPYDLSSDMHYGSTYFSANSELTIAPKDSRYQRTIGQRADLSFSDIKTANKVYCKNKCRKSLACKRNGYTNPKNCRECICPDGFSGTLCEKVAPSTGACGGLITNTSGIIQTPNYPLFYPGFVQCNWLIKAPPGNKIRLAFSSLFSTTCDLNSKYGPCDIDWLEIRDDPKHFYQGGPRYCCLNGPDSLVSQENELIILFKSTAGNSDSNGFRATYEFIDENGNPVTTSTKQTTVTTHSSTTTDTSKKPVSSVSSTQITTLMTTTTSEIFVTESIDHCVNRPCLNGGECKNTDSGFSCNCPGSYTGYRCESKLSKCSKIKCRNNGICLENIGVCLCANGYTGESCDSPIDSCSSFPCVKGACLSLNNTYKCLCYANYTGLRCEINISKKYCREGLCLNNGKCVESPLLEGFVCQCPKNFNGILCENSVCSSNVCGDNGTCVLNEEGGYYCKCRDGTTGLNCRSHPCLANVCGDYGVCQRVDSNYVCKCQLGYTGKNCETKIKVCDSNPCSNGECQEELGFDFNCECYPGFVGKKCDIPIISNSTLSKCHSSPCKNNGICFEKEDKFVCFCAPGYVGQMCEISYKVKFDICNLKFPCKNGKCKSVGNSYTCECENNYTGPNCDILDPCVSDPCLNQGLCILTPENDYMCKCSGGFTGKNCEFLPESCPNDLCSNGGTCVLDHASHLGYRCNCMPNYSGITCMHNINSCASNPCSKDQICINNGFSYLCVCIRGVSCPTLFSSIISSVAPSYQTYQATYRVIRKSACLNNPCKNDGRCTINELTGNYTCSCKFGYIGQHCETVDACLIKPDICKNGGICYVKDNQIGCNCTDNYEPPYCESFRIRNVDNMCQINVCRNGGTCVHVNLNQMTSMKCICSTNHTGVFCQDKINLDEPSNQHTVYDEIPTACKGLNKTFTSGKGLKLTRTPHTNDSYYLIEGDLIWYITGKKQADTNNWPVKIEKIFPDIEPRIDSISYDWNNNEYFIFKMNRYWKYTGNRANPSQPTTLLDGYPQNIKQDYGLKSVESGFFLNKNSSDNIALFFKDSKIIRYNNTKPLGIYFLPFDLTPVEFAINTDPNSFYILFENRLFYFEIDFSSYQVVLKSIDSDIKNSLMCVPFSNTPMTKSYNGFKSVKSAQFCPEINSISSIIKLNTTHGLMLTGNKLEYIGLTKHGYRLLENPMSSYLTINTDRDYNNSMINLNRILFIFQNDIVWIYSILNDTLVKNDQPGLFQNLFPNKNSLNSIISAHYSPRTKKFYFFSDKFYVEYETQNRSVQKTTIRNLSSRLTNVIQNHEDFDSVYLVDSNSFIYYLNLKNDYLESVDRRTASFKLFTDCIHE